MGISQKKTLEIFYSYAPKDELLREKLENQLGNLKRQGLITDWHHREIIPGTERRTRIDRHLATASIILLLISPDFIASDYCYSNEMARALEQHNASKARVIPIILRPTDYEGTPFETLQVLPSNGKPVTEYRSRDKAFLDIVKGVRQVIENIQAASEQDIILDASSQEYCHTIYEYWKTLDFKGILHINRNQSISIPLSDVFVLPNVLVGIPEYETVPRVQTEGDLLQHTLQEEYLLQHPPQKDHEANTNTNNTRFLPQKDQTSPREKHTTFQPREFQSVLSEHRRLVILGDPGSGKSTLLKYMMLLLAQNNTQFHEIFPQLVEENIAIPLYLPLATYADAWRHYAPGERSLEQFFKHYLRENYLSAYTDNIYKQLSIGKVLLLFDGLDEIPDASLRLQIVRQVEMFTQSYPMNRIIITSRIVGYNDAPISASAGYYSYALADFNQQQIKCFLQLWCPAYERSVKGTTDQQYLQSLATKEAAAIFESVQSRPAVYKLAGNPLLLTILALLQRQGTNFPAHRIELYDLCVTTLIDTWGKTKGISTTITSFNKHELVKILRPLAFWMHQHPAVSAIPEEELIEQVVNQLLDRRITRYEDEARKLAEDFLYKVRGETGILIERGKERYGFLHLTFEEFLAAGELEQREDRKDFIKTHLHDSRWREVILLTISMSGIVHYNERDATDLLRNAILEANSPFEYWLHRDLFLAGICLADDAGIDMECEDEIIERIISLALTSPYDALKEKISNIFTSWQSTRLAEKVHKMILPVLQCHNVHQDPLVRITKLSSRTYERLLERNVLQHYQTLTKHAQISALRLIRLRIMIPLCNPQIETLKWTDYALTTSYDPDGRVREESAMLLSRIEDKRPEIFQRLLDLLSDNDSTVRQAAAKAMGAREHKEDAVIIKLLSLITESNWRSKQVAAETLGYLGCKDSRVREQLLLLISDTNTDVRQTAIKVLWQLNYEETEITERFLVLLSDSDTVVKKTVIEILGSWIDISPKAIERFFDLLIDDDFDVRQVAALVLGHIGQRQPEIFTRLLELLSDANLKIREGAIKAIGQAGQKQASVLTELFNMLTDAHWQLRVAAAEALGNLSCDQQRTTKALINLLSDPFPSIRQAAANALGKLGNEQPEIIEKLLDLLYDTFPKVKQTAIQILGQWGQGKVEINEELFEQLTDPDCYTLLEVIKALEARNGKQSTYTPKILELMNHPSIHIRKSTISAVGQFSHVEAEVIEKLLDLLYDDDESVNIEATKALKQLGNKNTEILNRMSVMLTGISDSTFLSNLYVQKVLRDQQNELNEHITITLLKIVKKLGKGHIFLTETVLNFLTNPSSIIRKSAIEAIREIKDESQEVRTKLVELLDDYNVEVRKAAIKSLSRLGMNQPKIEMASILLPYLSDHNLNIRQAIVASLNELNGDISNKIHIILKSLISIYNLNNKQYSRYRQEAVKLLKQLLLYRPEITTILLEILSTSSADYNLQLVAAMFLGEIGNGRIDLIQQLVAILFSSETSQWEQATYIEALGLLGKNQPEVIKTLLNFASDDLLTKPTLEALAKSQVDNEQLKVAAKLLDFLPDTSINAGTINIPTQKVVIEALGHMGIKEPEIFTRISDLLSHPRQDIRTSAIETLGNLSDGQPEIIAKFAKILSSTNRNESNAALIALAKQSKEPMQIMNVLLKSLANHVDETTWRYSLSYVLKSPKVDRIALSQQLEKLLREHEPITKSNLTATVQANYILFALQQIFEA